MEMMLIILLLMLVVLGVPASIAAIIVVVVKADRKNKPQPMAQQRPAQPQFNAAQAAEKALAKEEQADSDEYEQVLSASEEEENEAPKPVQQPVYVPQPPRAPRKKMSASSIMMLIGTAFIILSAFTFVAANWVKMQPEGRVFTLAGAAVLAFTISAVMKAAAKLEGTPIAFYTIGSVVSAVTLITASGYELLGSWFSIGGDGAPTVFAISAALLSAASFAAFFLYKKEAFNYFGFSFISVILLFVCVQLTDNIAEFAPLITIVQAVVTATVHVIKPHKGTVMEKPVTVIGDVTAGFFAFLGGAYVLSSTLSPDGYTFAVLAVIMAQLLFYGIFRKQTWMIPVFNGVLLYTALVISAMINNEYGSHPSVMFFSAAALVIYLSNVFIPKTHPASKAISFIAAVIGSVVLLGMPCDGDYLVTLIVPAVMSAVIYLYTLNKNKDIQLAAGIFAPALPLFAASFSCKYFNETLAETALSYIPSMVYGCLVLVYLAVTAILVFLPKIAFGIHAKHPVQTPAVLYSNMIVSAFVLLFNSGYTPVFMFITALCIAHFALSYKLGCNATALGSTISLIILTSGVLKHFFPDSSDAVMYCMFALFIIMVIASRLIFSQSVIYKKDDILRIDVLLLSSIIATFTYTGFSKTATFLSFISIAVFLAGFIKKSTAKDTAAVLLSFSAVSAAIAALVRPFFIPESPMISSKITLAIFVLLGVAYKYIWRNHPEASKIISTLIFVCTFIGLIGDGIVNAEVMNRIFVLVVTAGILILSFYTKSKTWFITSSIALVVITVFSTREYFDKVGWWVYLFAVGVLLIAIAAINEALKKKGETMKSTVEKKFSDWTW